MELAILPDILRLWRRSHGGGLRSMGVSSNLHEDTSGVGGKSRVERLEWRPPFSRAGISNTAVEILIPWDLSLLRYVRTVGADLDDSNEVCSLPQGLGQRGLLLFSQGKLEAAALKTIQERCV